MTFTIGIPTIIFLVILQSTIVSRLNLSFGLTDIVMLVLIALGLQQNTKHTLLWFSIGGALMAIFSAIPLMYPLIPYIIISLIIDYLKKRIWKIPLLLMILVSFVGTVICNLVAFVIISITRVPLPITETINSVILPSIALNIAIGIPIFILVRDWSKWLNPRDEE
jgi:hypothetical protein